MERSSDRSFNFTNYDTPRESRQGIYQEDGGVGMRAYIVHDSPLGTDYWNEGEYSLITEKEVIVAEKWCSNRAFANHDLTVWNEDKLKDHAVTEVYSNGVVVWKDGKITDGVARAFLAAEREYELNNSDAL